MSKRGPKSPLFRYQKMDIKAKIAELAEGSLLSGDQFLVDVIVSSRNFSKITVIIDGDHGITIDDCGKISRALSEKLDELNLDTGTASYVLEVSTPGLDHPLKLRRQFEKNIGRNVKVHRKDKSIVLGKLTACLPTGTASTAETIVLKEEIKEGKTITEKEWLIPFDDVERTFVMVSFK
jgi:ribosome maturation factor RimP